ncbi:hypothetical protein OG500_36435 [Kitasatospora sp. NBC_01250]|uniref:hypothetical protein n=1 Tax=unclassified Kitasatospora TaxID=2633591 RepID=UPI002E11443F|nr:MULTISPECIES: hypothetical protein [unclassified Kitasatospora]WSJ71451.1 hypothetical protein OG294_38090 [Kitasatospora sp. NBC_01302]
MSARPVLGLAGAAVRAWLRACTVPEAHATSPLATFPEAALGAARAGTARAGAAGVGTPGSATYRP